MVTTRYSDQQGSKSRQKVMRLYKQWHRPISKRFIKPPYSIREQPRSTRNVVAYPRPAFSAKNRKNYAPTSFDQQVQVSQGHTFCTEIRKIEIPRSEAPRQRLTYCIVPADVFREGVLIFRPKTPFVLENLVLRDGFGISVPRQPAHLDTQAESGAYLRDSSPFPRRRPFLHFKPPYAIASVPSLSHHNCIPMTFTAESPSAQGQ